MKKGSERAACRGFKLFFSRDICFPAQRGEEKILTIPRKMPFCRSFHQRVPSRGGRSSFSMSSWFLELFLVNALDSCLFTRQIKPKIQCNTVQNSFSLKKIVTNSPPLWSSPFEKGQRHAIPVKPLLEKKFRKANKQFGRRLARARSPEKKKSGGSDLAKSVKSRVAQRFSACLSLLLTG